jgi:hypothetical protein
MSQKASRSEPVRSQTEYPDDEIELIDILRIIWKWKWIIIGFTLFCLLSVAIYGLTRPVAKLYKVSTAIEINSEARLGPLKKMKAEIEYGIFNQQVFNDFPNINRDENAKPLSIAVEIPNGLNMLEISHTTPDARRGEEVLDSIVKSLRKKYEKEIVKEKIKLDLAIDQKNYSIKKIHNGLNLTKKQLNLSIAKIKNKADEEAANIEALLEKISLTKIRIDQIEAILKQAESRSERLASEKMRAIVNPSNADTNRSIFLDAAAIHEIIDYPIVLRDRLDLLITRQKERLNKIQSLNRNIARLQEDIEILKEKYELEKLNKEQEILRLNYDIETIKEDRESLLSIIIKQPNKVLPMSFKHKTERNMILFGGIGFVFSIIFVFFLEHIINFSKRSKGLN